MAATLSLHLAFVYCLISAVHVSAWLLFKLTLLILRKPSTVWMDFTVEVVDSLPLLRDLGSHTACIPGFCHCAD